MDVTASGGLRLGAQERADSLSVVDTLVVPGGECLVTAAPTAALQAVIWARCNERAVWECPIRPVHLTARVLSRKSTRVDQKRTLRR
jgi:hypothetical protein